MASPSEPSFQLVLTHAETLARRRHEALTTLHLLAALGSFPSAVAELLKASGLAPRRVLDLGESCTESAEPLNLTAFAQALRATARRVGRGEETSIEVLLVLLADDSSIARRIFAAAGTDRVELGRAALQTRLVVQLQEPAKAEEAAAVTRAAASSERTRPSLSASPQPRGEVVSVVPETRSLPARSARSGSLEPAQSGPRSHPPSSSRARLRPPVAEQLNPGRARTEPSRRRFEAIPTELPVEDEPWSLSRQKFPILTGVGRNWAELGQSGRLDPVIGRNEEIEQALDILAKRDGNCPVLIGQAGVGKSAVARGIAARLAQGKGLGGDRPRILIEIPVSELVAGTGVRGALATRLQALKREVIASEGRVVLFFDDLHLLLSGEGAEEVSGELRLSLARGELPCIGACGADDYRKVIEADAALSRRFSAVMIEELSPEQCLQVLQGMVARYEAHHGVSYQSEALARAVSWSVRYLPARALPDKAMHILDLAAARSSRRGLAQVGPEQIAEVVAAQAGIDVNRLLETDGERLLRLEEVLGERVIGHEAHLRKIARILRRNAAGLGAKRPMGTFLLLGPTGVGKTETAKAIAEVWFQSELAMTRIDMAELSEAHAVSRLVGAPPGYIGHDAGGALTEAVRRRPYQVVLLDEIEKAHPDVLTAFLAVFDEGRMTDSRGRLVDFRNTVLILTSNLGAEVFSPRAERKVGFQASSKSGSAQSETSDQMVLAARRVLAPELYNRIDEVLVYSPLSRGDVLRIGRKLATKLQQELAESRGLQVLLEDSALELLLDVGGFEPELGARPLRRVMARKIEAPLAETILAGGVEAGDALIVSAVEGEFKFTKKSAHQAAE